MNTNDPLPGYQIWDNHPDWHVEMWMHEVANDETRRGYWEWVRAQIDAAQSAAHE